MADTSIVDRNSKGSALTQSEYDGNVSSMCGVVEEETGATHTIDHTDQNKTIQYNRGSAVAVTLTAAATIQSNIDTDNWKVTCKNIGAGAVTITGPASSIDGATTVVLEQYDSVTIQTDQAGTAFNIVSRDMAAVVASSVDTSSVDTESVSNSSGSLVVEGVTFSADDISGVGSLQFDSGVSVTSVQDAVSGSSSQQLLTENAIADEFDLHGAATQAEVVSQTETGVTTSWIDIDLDGTVDAHADLDLSGDTIVNNTGVALKVKATLELALISTANRDTWWRIADNGSQVGEYLTAYIQSTHGRTIKFSRIFTLSNGHAVKAQGRVPVGVDNWTINTGGTLTVEVLRRA